MEIAPTHKYPRWVIPTENLQQKVDLPGIVWRDPFLIQGEKEPGKVRCWLNGSSVVHKGKRWLAYRIELKRWFLWSRVCLVQLDDNWTPIPGTNKLLPLHTRFDGWGSEDPRLFVFRDKLHMAYGDGFRMLLAELTDKGDVKKSMYVPTNETISNPPYEHPREKNWGFFSLGDRLFAQQYCAPSIIVEFNPDTWETIGSQTHEWLWRSPHGANLHGSSSPIFHNGKLWRVCHTHKHEHKGEWLNWDGKLVDINAVKYCAYLMELESVFPFYPVSITRQPILWTDFGKFDEVSPTPHAVVFVGSQERDGDGWRFTYGENDCRIVTQKIPDSDLEDRVPIRYQDASNGVVSDSNNHLHFFWLQGENNLPEEDKNRIQKWKTMNPDWQVNIWDRKLMGDLVSQYPNCEKTWADLCTALDKFPNDRSIVAKVSDFSRLLILYTTHSYNQEWNIYADTDTVPLRSLTKFLRDEYLYGQFWEKFNDPKLNPAEKPWNWENIDFAVSQENRIDARPFTVTNAVLMGRPKSPVIMDLIKKGIDRRWQPTLKAWGPSMLQENLENSVNQNKGWRTTILPYHYLVYNPGQHHNDPAPSWTLCHHLNSYRWETPGVKGTLTGGLNGPVKNAQIV